MSEGKSIAFWVKITALDSSHFDKITYIISKSSQGKRPFNQLPYGTIQVRVNSTEKFHQLMGWIEGLKEVELYSTKLLG
jgi:hypothetical protein